MFKRERHIQIATILQSLDADKLRKRGCYFGGGTAIVMSHGEFRESLDVDFLISDTSGYREIRQEIATANSLLPIVRRDLELTQARDIRTDQYGIRTSVKVGRSEIKFEIVFEARIELESPSSKDRICGISTLTLLDMASSKLLANSDRWADDSVYSRDLIDLAMLGLSREQLRRAIEKAANAYGTSIESDLRKAISKLKERPGRLDECMNSLSIDFIPKALLWKKIRALGLTTK